MDHRALLDHQFRVAAFAVTWIIQLAYLGWLGYKCHVQRRSSARLGRNQ